jgi:phosphoenolpyruvate carboxykinase (GTP)
VAVIGVKDWVDQIAALTNPDSIKWCDGSAQEFESIKNLLVASGSLIPLNPKLRPNSFLSRTDPRDVARVEERLLFALNLK